MKEFDYKGEDASNSKNVHRFCYEDTASIALQYAHVRDVVVNAAVYFTAKHNTFL